MAATPPLNRPAPPAQVMAFIDGANLFNSVKRRFNYWEPNCDIAKLAKALVALTPNRVLLKTT